MRPSLPTKLPQVAATSSSKIPPRLRLQFQILPVRMYSIFQVWMVTKHFHVPALNPLSANSPPAMEESVRGSLMTTTTEPSSTARSQEHLLKIPYIPRLCQALAVVLL